MSRWARPSDLLAHAGGMPFVPGHSYYFIARTRRLEPVFAAPAAVQRLRTSMWRATKLYAFTIDAVGIRPDTVFSLWTLPAGDHNYTARWRYIRADFSRWRSADRITDHPGAARRSPWQTKVHAVQVADVDEYQRLLAHVRSQREFGLP